MGEYVVNTEVLDKLERRLRRFTLHSKLEMLRKLSHVVDWDLPNETLLKQMFPNRTPKFYIDFKRSCYLHELAYLSLISTVAGEWSGHLESLNDYKDFRKIINISKSYRVPFTHKRDVESERSANLFFVRTALQQFIYQESPLIGTYKYWYLFKYQHNDFNVKERFKEVFEFDFVDYFKFVIAVYILSNNSYNALTVDAIISEIGKGENFTPYKVSRILQVLSMDRGTAIQKYNEFKSDDERMKIYNYNPYLMKPFLINEKNIYLPIPPLLFKAVTEGFYQMLCFVQKDFRGLFGKYAFEDYIHHLLVSTPYNVIKEFTYYMGKQELKSPDFILVNGDDVVLIEVKGNAPSIALRDSDMETYKKELNRAYVKAVGQCIKKYEHILAGVLQHKQIPKSIRRISYLVITLEEFYMVDSIQMKEMLDEQGLDLKEIHFHVMGSSTLEAILESDDRGIFGYLHNREDNGTVYSHLANADIKYTNTKTSRNYMLWEEITDDLIKDLFS